MVVEELIKELQKYPSNMRVLGRGYESGYNDLDRVSVAQLCHVPDNPWYEGQYQEKYSWYEGYDFTDCLTIS